MKIGALSKLSGVSIRMLRYYEERGLLKPHRTHAGYREFDQGEVLTLERIKLLNSAGMTLDTIEQFLPCIRGEQAIFEPCDELRVTLREQIAQVKMKTKILAERQQVLESFLREVESD